VNAGVDNDMYVDKDDFIVPKLSRKQLQMTDTLAEGRFAIVRRAHLDTGKERSVVAAKALRSKRCTFSLIINYTYFHRGARMIELLSPI